MVLPTAALLSWAHFRAAGVAGLDLVGFALVAGAPPRPPSPDTALVAAAAGESDVAAEPAALLSSPPPQAASSAAQSTSTGAYFANLTIVVSLSTRRPAGAAVLDRRRVGLWTAECPGTVVMRTT
ncbi:hypothetical protein GCM10009682_37440 [Luedemannella flava]|uniref:Secreted protein n=1 Tax=Luedemannella flava TaxID=349316 RepID=A0ABN2M888_9ACTN